MKTKAAYRSVPLTKPLKDLLLQNKPKNTEDLLVLGNTPTPYTASKFKRAWERIGKTIELYGATSHIIRHAFITYASDYVDIKTLQHIVGHSNAKTTLNVYSHYRDQKLAQSVKGLSKLYS